MNHKKNLYFPIIARKMSLASIAALTLSVGILSIILISFPAYSSSEKTLNSSDFTSSTPTSSASLSSIWDLTDLYKDTQHWQHSFDQAKLNLNTIEQCRGKLGDSAATLANCLTIVYNNYRQLLQIYTYAFLKKDTDLANSTYSEHYSKAQNLLNEYSKTISFVEPELITIGSNTLQQWLKKHDALTDYSHFINNTMRKSKHVLSPREEEILAAANDPLGVANNAYTIFTNAELPWPEVVLSDGKAISLRASNYSKYRGVKTRNDRKIIFDAFFGSYQNYKETLAATLSGEIKRQVFNARMRGFNSSLQQAMDADNIPEQVYHTLVNTVNSNLDTLHRYLALRAEWMKIDDPRYYDVYPSLIENNRTYSIEDSKKILSKALQPLGKEYTTLLNTAMAQNWMHQYPKKGKRSGAYVMGAAYDVHPYVLLNHNNNFESLSTFAHEWGHGIHTLLSNASQPFPKADYATFIAEIASTANEILLFDYLRSKARNNEERLFYLFQELQGLRGTFFRQTQFAEFELAIHQEIEKGEALSGDKLNRIYGEILKRYYVQPSLKSLQSDKKPGPGTMSIDDIYTVEWAYIPHFYRNFYVYQYATSISAAYYLVEKILNGDADERQQYLSILKAGGSDYPYDILKRAGVDMASPEVYLAVIRRCNQIMDEIEALKI